MGLAISGQNGSIKIGANTLLNIGDWEITETGDTADTTSFQEPGAWKEYTPTVKHWTAKATGRHDSADALGQVALINAFNTVVAVKFMVDASANWSGNAISNGMHPKADANGVVTTEYDFQGTGPCTFSLT